MRTQQGGSRRKDTKHPTFLTHWPAAQAALARRDPADSRVAERFELCCCGIELANAFVELTGAAEQRARFVEDRTRRHALYGPDWEMDEAFLSAVERLTPSVGIALGFDRLAMLVSGASRISDVLWLPCQRDVEDHAGQMCVMN
jgi:lysyl-tRNA synthetase class 2